MVLYWPCPLDLLGILSGQQFLFPNIPQLQGTRGVLGDLASGASRTICPGLRGPPTPITCLGSCQAPSLLPSCLLNTFSLLEPATGRMFSKMKPNLSKAKQFKERTPRAVCHPDISNMQMEWLSNPREQKNTL